MRLNRRSLLKAALLLSVVCLVLSAVGASAETCGLNLNVDQSLNMSKGGVSKPPQYGTGALGDGNPLRFLDPDTAYCESSCCWASGCNVTCSETKCTATCGSETSTTYCKGAGADAE